VVVVEVTSNSTEDSDRGAKLAHYQQIDALQSVVLVSHRRRCLTVVSRTAQGWVSRDFEAGSSAVLAGPVATLEVDEIYAAATGP